jgi:stage II sporulation protein D
MIERLSPCRTAILALTIVGAGCATGTTPRRDPAPSAAVDLPTVIRVRTAGRVLSVPLEEYVLGTALSEVSPVGESTSVATGIFRLQAILARTYAVAQQGRHRQEGFDLCDTTHCQLYEPARLKTSRFVAVARQAVTDTAGQVLMFGQRPAETLFHADCGGHTADAETIWGGRVPYLIGAPDPVPQDTHRRWQVSLRRDHLRDAFNASPVSRVGRRLTSLRIAERDASGRAARIEIKGEEATYLLRGEQVRAILNRTFGQRAILSTRFTVSPAGEDYRFEGTGFGHGVGLCQVGAAARLRRNEPVRAVLTSYFPGTRLTPVRTRPSRF